MAQYNAAGQDFGPTLVAVQRLALRGWLLQSGQTGARFHQMPGITVLLCRDFALTLVAVQPALTGWLQSGQTEGRFPLTAEKELTSRPVRASRTHSLTGSFQAAREGAAMLLLRGDSI